MRLARERGVFGDAGPFRILDGGPAPQAGADTFENADRVSRAACVTAQQHLGCVRADHSDVRQPVPLQRQERPIVLEQGRTRDPLGFPRVDERILEQAELELGAQQPSHDGVDGGLGNAALPDLIDECAVRLDVGQLDVHAGGEGSTRRLRAVGRDVVEIGELRDGEPVGDDHSVEPPFPAQHIVQQPVIGVGRNAVHLVVRRHHAARACLLDDDFKGVEKHVPQRAFSVGRGADVRPRLGLAMPGHMLERREHMGRSDHGLGPL